MQYGALSVKNNIDAHAFSWKIQETYKNIASWKVSCMARAKSGEKGLLTMYPFLKNEAKQNVFVACTYFTYLKIKCNSRTKLTVNLFP